MNDDRHQIKDVIAERELGVASSPPRRLVVRIGKPFQHEAGDWACETQIEGLRNGRVYQTFGVDAIQALQLALERVRIDLRFSGEPIVEEASHSLTEG